MSTCDLFFLEYDAADQTIGRSSNQLSKFLAQQLHKGRADHRKLPHFDTHGKVINAVKNSGRAA